MADSGQIISQAVALEIEPFRYSDSAGNQKLSQWSESLSIAFPYAGSGLDGYGDQTTDALLQVCEFREVSELFSGDEAQRSRSGEPAPGDSRSTGEAALARTSEASGEQFPGEESTAAIEAAEERGRSQGIEIGLAQGREEMSGEIRKERERLVAQAAALLGSFSEARENCLHHLEQEAVGLALAIAARILRREAQTDPLLLIGAVRVALGQLASSTTVRLKVPAQDQAMWEESLALMPGLAIRPKVIGEAAMELGECRMETEIGSADLGLWAQLKAIEKGFFYRLGDPFGSGGRDGDAVAAESPAGVERRGGETLGSGAGEMSFEQRGSGH